MKNKQMKGIIPMTNDPAQTKPESRFVDLDKHADAKS